MGSAEWFIVVNSYQTADGDYQIQQCNFHFNFPSNDSDWIKLFKQWQPNKNTLEIGWQQPNDIIQIVTPEPLQPNKATGLSTKLSNLVYY